MNDKRLKQVHSTLAFLRSVIMSGEPMTNNVRNAIDDAICNLRDADKDINESITTNSMRKSELKQLENNVKTEFANAGNELTGKDLRLVEEAVRATVKLLNMSAIVDNEPVCKLKIVCNYENCKLKECKDFEQEVVKNLPIYSASGLLPESKRKELKMLCDDCLNRVEDGLAQGRYFDFDGYVDRKLIEIIGKMQ